MASPLGGEHQPLALQIVHDDDATLPALQAGRVDTRDADAFEVLQRARLGDPDPMHHHGILSMQRSRPAA
ncbi:MAG: hypothetical protein ACK5TD_00340 [bacterium]|nr:hypothetical protein [Rubrivivax sp.]